MNPIDEDVIEEVEDMADDMDGEDDADIPSLIARAKFAKEGREDHE